jgi:hypothetical protein
MHASALRLAPAVLLILEGLSSGVWVAGLLGSLQGHGAVAVILVLARGLVGALQFTSGWLLLTRRLPAIVLAQAALLVSALLVVLETGFRLVPSNAVPTYRWLWVAVYLAYALGMSVFLSSLAKRDDAS